MNIKIMCDKGSTIQSRVLKNMLMSKGIEIVTKAPDYVVIVGNDATFLRSLKKQNYDAYPIYVGLNSGSFGYFQNTSFNNVNSLVSFIQTNEYIDRHVDFISIANVSYIFKSGRIIKDNYIKDFKIQGNEDMLFSISDGEDFKDNVTSSEITLETKYNLNNRAVFMDDVNIICLSSPDCNTIIGKRFEIKVKSNSRSAKIF